MDSVVAQKRKLTLQYGKFKHVVSKINSALQSDSDVEEFETWKERLNLVAANYDLLLMETVSMT